MLQRLNKAIAARGICSRRKADELIFAGKVKVNGILQANPATRINPDDVIEIFGKNIGVQIAPVYALMNKPPRAVCTRSDPEGRHTVMDLLPENLKNVGLFPVGRLDYFSEGLLLLTNDGELALRLAHPRYEHSKLYEVIVRENVSASALSQIRRGMTLEDGTRLLPVKARARLLPSKDTLVTMELRQGINRQIRRMCAALRLTILRLRRIAEGPLKLGDLKPGQTRLLSPHEVKILRNSAGLE